MLAVNPSKRITAAEALKHPWICVSIVTSIACMRPQSLHLTFFVLVDKNTAFCDDLSIRYCLAMGSVGEVLNSW